METFLQFGVGLGMIFVGLGILLGGAAEYLNMKNSWSDEEEETSE